MGRRQQEPMFKPHKKKENENSRLKSINSNQF